LLKRVSWVFTVVLTGFATGAELSWAFAATAVTRASKTSDPVSFIAFSYLWAR
jgi:hypothetical protein